jgi:hypothetical protein
VSITNNNSIFKPFSVSSVSFSLNSLLQFSFRLWILSGSVFLSDYYLWYYFSTKVTAQEILLRVSSYGIEWALVFNGSYRPSKN